MRLSGNRLAGIPPANVPFRFFLTAPWFAIFAALALLVNGPDTWSGIRNPELVAIVHLLTLGFVTMTILGALIQLLPVLGGKSIPAVRPVALCVHLFFVTGVLCLCVGMGLRLFILLPVALPALGLALGVFILATGSRLIRIHGGGNSIHALRFALISLLAAAGIGSYLAFSYIHPLEVSVNLTALHMGWALIGWVLIPVMAISFQVIPMFQVTPDYPPGLTRSLPALLFVTLLLPPFLPTPYAMHIPAFVTGMAALLYAGFSLRLLQRRKRRGADATVRFWQLGLTCLILAIPTFWLVLLVPATDFPEAFTRKAWLLAGTLTIAGFAASVIMGMLQKIVPFLAYLHLQHVVAGNAGAVRHLPHMHVIIRPGHSGRLLYLHGMAVLALAGAVVFPPLTRPAAVILLLDFGWLAYLVTGAMVLYARTGRRLAAMTAG